MESKEYQDWMEGRERIYQKLNEHIKSTCAKYKSQKYTKFHRQLMVDSRHKIAFCRNPKVGTSAWMIHFARLDPGITMS